MEVEHCLCQIGWDPWLQHARILVEIGSHEGGIHFSLWWWRILEVVNDSDLFGHRFDILKPFAKHSVFEPRVACLKTKSQLQLCRHMMHFPAVNLCLFKGMSRPPLVTPKGFWADKPRTRKTIIRSGQYMSIYYRYPQWFPVIKHDYDCMYSTISYIMLCCGMI